MSANLNQVTRPAFEQMPVTDRALQARSLNGDTSRAALNKVSDRSSHSRSIEHGKRTSRLLIDATRDFGNIKRPSSEQITQYKELFYQLIDQLCAPDRRMISAMLARLPFTPRAVALYFAQDQLDIAAPFLLFSQILGDLDLRAIAKKKGKSYAEIIKKRHTSLDAHTNAVLDKIISGEQDIVISQAELKTVVSPIDSVEKPQAKWLDGNEIVALASVGGRLGKGTSEPLKRETVEVAPVVRIEIDTLPKTETRRLLSLARKQDLPAVSGYIKELSGLETDASLRLMKSKTGDELLYLVKALGLAAPHDMQLILMLAPRLGRSIESYQHAKMVLSELETGICRMIFNEIGARFNIAGNNNLKNQSALPEPAMGFQDAARRRRSDYERAPLSATAPKQSRFSFEKSFITAS
ncbi:MAG: hypothetical protein WBC71_04150 [Salaquimonas sp.]